MGVINRIFGIGPAARDVGNAISDVAEVFTVNKTKAELAAREQSMASLAQYRAEFSGADRGWFDSIINGVNRLPRPVMALGTVGMFVFAMADPQAFAGRMQGLAYVPEPLWWLLGAIVSFYFGARELHYTRNNRMPVPPQGDAVLSSKSTTPATDMPVDGNAALDEWLSLQSRE